MKITKSQLKQIVKEELGMMEDESEIESFPRVRKLIGDDLLDRTFAKMEELQAEMDSAYEMGGNRGGPYPKDSKLFLRALESLL